MGFFNRISFAFLAIVMIHCMNPSPGGQKSEMPGRIFLSNSVELRDGLLKTISDDSDILMGGYILIIPVGIDPEDERILYLEKKIGFSLPNAVHILKVRQDENLLSSERITVEGASLIFLVGGGLNRFMKMSVRNGLAGAVKQAHNEGAIIVGLNQSASLIGEYTIQRRQVVSDEVAKSPEDPYRVIEGLHLLPGFITDIMVEDEINLETGSVRGIVDTMDFQYIGILPDGIVMIGNSAIYNLGKSDIVIRRSGPSGGWTVLKGSKTLQLD